MGQTTVPELDYWANQYQHPYAGPPETMPAWPKQTRDVRVRKDVPEFIAGSTFVGTETWMGKSGLRTDRFRIDLFTRGSVTMQGVDGTKYGTWKVEGDSIIIRLHNSRTVYVGTRLGDKVLGGAANGQATWNWMTDRGYEPWTLTSGIRP